MAVKITEPVDIVYTLGEHKSILVRKNDQQEASEDLFKFAKSHTDSSMISPSMNVSIRKDANKDTGVVLTAHKGGTFIPSVVFYPDEIARSVYPELDEKLGDTSILGALEFATYSEYSDRIVVPVQSVGLETAKIQLSKSQEKELLKVYETPTKTLERYFSDIADIYRRKLIQWLNDEKNNIRNSQDYPNKEDTLRIVINFIGELELMETNLKSVFPFIYKNFNALQKILGTSKLKEPPQISIFDPQAGSGQAMLKMFDEFGIQGVLTGVEIRDIQNNDPRYAVATGIDSNTFLQVWHLMGYSERFYVTGIVDEIIKKVVPQGERDAFKRGFFAGFFWSNPPYGEGPTARITYNHLGARYIDSKGEPHYGFHCALLSKKIAERVKLDDCLSVEMKASETGYEGDNVPETFLYIYEPLHKRNRPLNDNEIRDEVFSWLYKRNETFINDATVAAKYAKAFMQEMAIAYNEFFVNNFDPNKFFSVVDVKHRAIAGDPVFPAYNRVEGGLISYNEVKADRELIQLYKENYRGIYDLLLSTAEAKMEKIEGLIDRSDVSYIASSIDELGVIKYKYLPFIIQDVSKVKDIILEHLDSVGEPQNDDDKQNIKLVRSLLTDEELSKNIMVMVKSRKEVDAKAGLGFGYVSKLTLSKKTGETLAVIEMDIDEFYKKALERGAIQLNVKHISEHPQYDEFLKNLMNAFVDKIVNQHSIFTQEEKEYILQEYKRLVNVEHKEPKEAVRIIAVALYNKHEEENRLLLDTMFDVDIIEKSIETLKNTMKSLGISGNTATKILEVFSKYNALYNENPLLFLENLMTKSEIKTYPDGLSISEKITRELNELGLGQRAEDLVKSYISEFVYLSKIDDLSRISILKNVYSFLYAKSMERDLQQNNIKKAFNSFRKLHVDILGLKPYQFDVPLNVVALQTLAGIKTNVYGWEMRSGKTLATTFDLFCSSLVSGKPSMFEVRTANAYDIVKQIVEFLPYMANDIAMFPGDVKGFKEKYDVLTSNAFPNPFSRPSLFKGRGSKVAELLAQSPFTLMEKMELSDDEVKQIKETLQDKPYGILFKLENFNQKAIAKLVKYLNSIENDLVLNEEEWKKFYLACTKYDYSMKPLNNTENKLLWIVSKDTHHLRMNYNTRKSSKVLYSKARLEVRSNADVNLPIVEGESSYLNDYVVFALDEKKYEGDKRINVEDFMRYATYVGNINDRNIYMINIKDDLGRHVVRKFENVTGITVCDEKGQPTSHINATPLTQFLWYTTNKKQLSEAIKALTNNREAFKSLNIRFPFAIPTIVTNDGVPSFALPDDNNVKATEMSIREESRGITTNIFYVYDQDYKPIYEGTQTNKSAILYSTSLYDKFSKIAIDEADQSTRVDSPTNKVLRAMSEKCNTAIVSGTVSGGDVSSLVSFLNLSLSEEAISEITNMATLFYDRYDVADEQYGEYFSSFLQEIIYLMETSDENEDRQFVLSQLLRDFREGRFMDVIDHLTSIESSINQENKEKLLSFKHSLDSVSMVKFSNRHSIVSSCLYNGQSYNKILYSYLNGLSQARLVKKGIGTANMSFTKIIPDDTYVSLTSGEKLSGVHRQIVLPGKESAMFTAIKNVLEKKAPSMDYRQYNYGIVQTKTDMDKALLDQLLKPDIDISSGLYQSDLRDSVDGRSVAQLNTVFTLLTNAVSLIEKEIMHNKHFEDWIDLVSKSGKTTHDGLTDVVKAMLLGEREFSENMIEALGMNEEDDDEEEQKFNIDSEIPIDDSENNNVNITTELDAKKLFAKKVLNSLLNPSIVIDKENQNIYITVTIDGRKITVTDALSRWLEDGREIVKAFKIGQSVPYTIDLNVFAGMDIDKKIFKDKKSEYWIKYSFIGARNSEIIDATANRGLIETLKNDARSGNSFVVLPSRVHLINHAIAETLTSLVRRENKEIPAQVIVRMTDNAIKSFVSRIDREYLSSHNIVLKTHESQAFVDKELLALKSDNAMQEMQTIVIAPSASTSRGVDLSMFDKMYIYPSIPNTREFLQISQRLFNPAKFQVEHGKNVAKAEVVMFGTPLKKSAFDRERYLPTQSSIITTRNLAKKDFTDQIMNGSLSITVRQDKVVSFVSERLKDAYKEQDLQMAI